MGIEFLFTQQAIKMKFSILILVIALVGALNANMRLLSGNQWSSCLAARGPNGTNVAQLQCTGGIVRAPGTLIKKDGVAVAYLSGGGMDGLFWLPPMTIVAPYVENDHFIGFMPNTLSPADTHCISSGSC